MTGVHSVTTEKNRQWADSLLSRDVTTFQEYNIYLSVDSSIVPGQPIPITVIFYVFIETDIGNGCYIEIFLETPGYPDQRIFQHPSDSSMLTYGPGPPVFPNVFSFSAQIAPPDVGSLAGRLIYRFGQHTLRVELTTNGRQRGPFIARDVLNVVPEQNPGGWWKWISPTDQLREWKQEYILSGFCANPSMYSSLSFEARLEESDETVSTQSLLEYGPQSADQVPISASATVPTQSVALQFKITQDWGWLVQGVWVTKGTLDKFLGYVAQIIVRDDWGNEYAPTQSSSISVHVAVSGTKKGLAVLAFNSNVSAIALGAASAALGALPPLAAVLGAAATVAGIVAAIAGDKALDPPTPSRRFLEEVAPARFRLPEKGWAESGAPGVGSIAKFFEEVGQLLNDLTALDEIYARLLGARLHASLQGEELQRASYRQLVDRMLERAAGLTTAAASAARALAKAGMFRSAALTALIAGDEVVPRQRIGAGLRRIGLPREAIEAGISALDGLDARKAMLSEAGVRAHLEWMGMSLADVVGMIAREVDRL